MTFIVTNGCWLSLTVSPSALELLHISHCLLWLLAVYHYLSDPMQLVHVSHCALLLLPVSHCLSDPMELLHDFHCLQ